MGGTNIIESRTRSGLPRTVLGDISTWGQEMNDKAEGVLSQ